MVIGRPSILIAAAALAVGAAACGGTSKSSSSSGGVTTSAARSSKSGPPPASCTSISEAFAQQIVGGPIDPPSSATAPSTGCLWFRSDKLAEGITVLDVSPTIFDGGLKAKRSGVAQAAFTYEDVSGLGDVAYFQTPKGADTSTLGGNPILLVRKGDSGYNISVRLKGQTAEQLQALEKQVAEQILKG